MRWGKDKESLKQIDVLGAGSCHVYMAQFVPESSHDVRLNRDATISPPSSPLTY
jgi:hypothetical protein